MPEQGETMDDTDTEALQLARRGDAIASKLETLCPTLSQRQQRYLAHLVGTGSVGEAAKAAGVETSTVRSWRSRDSGGFAVAEQAALEEGASFSQRLTRLLFASASSAAASVILEEMTEAPHSRDRQRAAESILSREYPVPTPPTPVGATAAAGLALLEALRSQSQAAPTVTISDGTGTGSGQPEA
jgi:hypothetical protein